MKLFIEALIPLHIILTCKQMQNKVQKTERTAIREVKGQEKFYPPIAARKTSKRFAEHLFRSRRE